MSYLLNEQVAELLQQSNDACRWTIERTVSPDQKYKMKDWWNEFMEVWELILLQLRKQWSKRLKVKIYSPGFLQSWGTNSHKLLVEQTVENVTALIRCGGNITCLTIKNSLYQSFKWWEISAVYDFQNPHHFLNIRFL